MTWRQWWCLRMPWHGLIHMFWASDIAEVAYCPRCKETWVLNHDIGAVLPWDMSMQLFYRGRR